MIKHLLIPLDGSELAATAIPLAKSILAPDGKVTLLSVVQPLDTPVYDFYPVPMSLTRGYGDELKEASRYAQDYLEKIADNLRADGVKSVFIHIETGDPAVEIVAAAEKMHVDAIVMSTHGRSGFSRWLFGSVTQKVLSAALCPILVVPGNQPAPMLEADTARAGVPNVN
ncbi:MAG: universal stress protein [Chloroflexota bacterium]|nr:universal stress protein [Chloroflexota bacterium]